MNKIYLTILLGSFMVFSLNAQIHVSGAVSGTWSDTVYVDGDVWISEGESLWLSPGTRVMFTTPALFSVSGSIKSAGTASQPILFTVTDTAGFADTSSLAGAWQGLLYTHMIPNADSSVFTHTRFEYTKDQRDAGEISFGGAVTASGFGKLLFDHCIFSTTHSWGGGGAVALTDGADAAFKDCLFTGCRVYDSLMGFGGAIYSYGSSPLIEKCIFENNRGVWLGGAICFYYSDPLLRLNEFTGNRADIGGALSLVHCRGQRVINNNLVRQNMASFFGGGIACNNACDPVLVNNTITENMAAYGAGFYCNDSSAPTVINTIITGNQSFGGPGEQVYIWDIYSHPNFYYCNIQGGLEGFAGSGAQGGYHGIYQNNLDTVNLFDPGANPPFYLSDSSPMRDAGIPDTTGLQIPATDFAGHARIVLDRIDIGAFEWQPVYLSASSQTAIEATVLPNPVSGPVQITLPDGSDGIYILTFFDAMGRVIWREEQASVAGVIHTQIPSCAANQEAMMMLSLQGKGKWFMAKVILSR